MDIVEGLRKVIQELLVPELRGIKDEVKGLSLRLDQMDKRFEQMQEQMDERFDHIDKRFEQMQKQMDERFNLVFKEFFSIRELLGEMNSKLDLTRMCLAYPTGFLKIVRYSRNY